MKRRSRNTLAELPLFAQCSRKELVRIARLGAQVDVRAGEIICREGNPGRDCYVIVEGRATASIDGRTVATLGRGAVLGEIALLDGGPRTATVVADTPIRLYVFDPSEFESMLAHVPSVARKVMATLSTRLRTVEAGAR